MYVDNLVSARRLFDEMLVRDIICWNAMLSGYLQSSHYEECLQLYREMEAGPDDVLPNYVTVLSMLRACSRLENLSFGLEAHRFAVEYDVKMDRVGWNSIISFYAKCGCLDFACQVFNEMSDREDVTYSTLITGYMSHGLVALAIELFQKVDFLVLSMWNTMIAGLAQNDSHGQVLDLLRWMQAFGFRPNAGFLQENDVHIFGYVRTKLSDDDLRTRICVYLQKGVSAKQEDVLSRFLLWIKYVSGSYDNADGKSFAQAHKVLELMKSFMVLTNDEDLRAQARAIELVRVVAMAVGRTRMEPIQFSPFIEVYSEL